ncbi:MAG: hypothetical protein P8P56_12300, partial [Yoonia sp.]|nr:hypothetical protein [Yoonia sp.]
QRAVLRDKKHHRISGPNNRAGREHLQAVENDVAIKGNLRAQSVLKLNNPIWELSTGRAAEMRTMLEAGGLDPARVARITGAGDREPAVEDSTSERNNRLEIVLLRSDI